MSQRRMAGSAQLTSLVGRPAPAQALPQAPQFCTVLSAVHAPAQQPSAPAQERPQAPQFAALSMALQAPPQQSSLAAQARPHTPQFCFVIAAPGAYLSMQPAGSMSVQLIL